jgi:uncharacterized protein (TIGR02099 family)
VKPVWVISWRRRLANWLRQRLWWFAAGGMLLLAVWVVLAKQLLTMLPAWRGDLETVIEARIQTPLEIGVLTGHMSGLSPVFVLEDVRLPGNDPELPGLTLERVELTVDVLASLLQRTLRARAVLVRGLEVRMYVDEDGRISLHGIDALGSQSASPEPPLQQLLKILYRQNRIQVEQVRGTLTIAGVPTLEIADISMAMVSSGTRHRLALQARTGADEASIDLRLDMRGDAYQRGDINGRGYLRITLKGAEPWLLPHWPLALKPEQISGAAEGWLVIRGGEVQQGSLRTRMDGLALSGGPFAERWVLTRLEADAALTAVGEGYQLELARFVLADADNRWRPGAMTLGWNVAGHQDWQVALHDVDLAPFTSLLLRLPWRDDHPLLSLSARLEALQPSGTLRRFSLRGVGRELTTLSSRFEDVSVQSDGRLPGVSGLSGWLSGSGERGYARIDSPTLTMQLPAQFDQPLSAAARGVLRWDYDGELLDVRTGWLKVSNDDARAQLLAGLRWQREQVPQLTLMAALTDGRAATAAQYIPVKKLSPAAASWLQNAFVNGEVTLGQFLHEGPVAIDPARQQDRTLQMQYIGQDFTLRFLPDWPLVTDLNARVLIDGRDISGREVSATLMGSQVRQGAVDIPARLDHEVVRLIISGTLDGPAEAIGTLLQGTPLAAQMPAELADWRVAGGRYQGAVLLHWPLGDDPAGATVRALGRVEQVGLSSEVRGLNIGGLTGDFSFDLNEGMVLPAFQASLFDQPVAGRIDTGAGRTRISWQGRADIARVRDWLALDWLKPASGEFEYVSELALPWRQEGPLTLRAESTLTPLRVDLPAPFGKSAGSPAPFRLELTSTETGPDLSLRYHNWLSARVLLEDGRLHAGRIRLGGGAALRPALDGLTIEGKLPALALADWGDVLAVGGGAGGDWPFVDLTVGKLDLYGFPVADVRLNGTPQDAGWRLQVEAPVLAGTLDVPAGYQQRGDQPMVLVVDRAVLERAPGSDDGTLSPQRIPVMDVQLRALTLNNEDMGRWQFALRPMTSGIVIEELDAAWRNTTIRGRIEWTGTEANQRSHFVGSLASNSLMRTLRRWEMEPFIDSEEARAVLDIRWDGAPTGLDYLKLQGQASVAIGPGRFPKTDSKTSALRVLGVFNVATVSRRLRLDFSDLYKKGLSFEEISGDFTLDGSLVGTSNLQIKSPSAELRLRGEMDIEAQTLDHYMEVTLPVSSNLYVGCLAGPAACAGIFVVERLWGDRLEKMTSLGYRVTGSWDEPKVEEAHSGSERRERP